MRCENTEGIRLLLVVEPSEREPGESAKTKVKVNRLRRNRLLGLYRERTRGGGVLLTVRSSELKCEN